MCVRPRKSKVPGFFLPCLFALLGVTPKFQQPRLLRVKCQTVLCEPLRYDILHLLRVFPVVEAKYGIIGKTDLVSFTPKSGLHHVLKPFVEQVGRDES